MPATLVWNGADRATVRLSGSEAQQYSNARSSAEREAMLRRWIPQLGNFNMSAMGFDGQTNEASFMLAPANQQGATEARQIQAADQLGPGSQADVGSLTGPAPRQTAAADVANPEFIGAEGQEFGQPVSMTVSDPAVNRLLNRLLTGQASEQAVRLVMEQMGIPANEATRLINNVLGETAGPRPTTSTGPGTTTSAGQGGQVIAGQQEQRPVPGPTGNVGGLGAGGPIGSVQVPTVTPQPAAVPATIQQLPLEEAFTRGEQIQSFINDVFGTNISNPVIERAIDRRLQFASPIFDLLQPGGGRTTFREALRGGGGVIGNANDIRQALTRFLASDINDPNNVLADFMTSPRASTMAGRFAPAIQAAALPRALELAPDFRDIFMNRVSRFAEQQLLDRPGAFTGPQDLLRELQRARIF